MTTAVRILLFLALVFLRTGNVFAEEESTQPTPVATPSESPAALPAGAEEAIKKGTAAFAKGDFKAAKKSFTKLLELMPGHPSALVNLATAEFRLGNLSQAETLLREALAKEATKSQVWITLGIVCLGQSKFYEALSALSQAVVLEPENSRAHSYLGVTAGRMGWLQGAEAELRRAIELDPTYADAQFNLALVYLQRVPPAIELARRHYYAALDLGAAPDPVVAKQLAAADRKQP